MLVGLIFFVFQHGWAGLLYGLAGLLLGMVLLLVPFTMGGIGGGDVKLLGAVGSLKGVEFVFQAFLASALAGGLLALTLIIWRRELWATLKWSGSALKGLVYRVGSRGQVRMVLPPFPSGGVSFPYGVAIVVGTGAILAMEGLI